MWDWIPCDPNSCNQYINYKRLFTMVPINDSLTIIRDRLSADKDLEELFVQNLP